MAKKQLDLEVANQERIDALRAFYHPRKRNPYTGLLFNHKTGEFYKPVPRTKQSFVAECDINNIIKSFKVTGQIKHINEKAAQGAYVDLPDPIDFQEALHQVKDAQASFMTLPSQVRSRFDNDPGRFLEFMADPNNQDEIIKLGLAKDTRPPSTPQPPSSSTGDLKLDD